MYIGMLLLDYAINVYVGTNLFAKYCIPFSNDEEV
jgi:hypothetical protein